MRQCRLNPERGFKARGTDSTVRAAAALLLVFLALALAACGGSSGSPELQASSGTLSPTPLDLPAGQQPSWPPAGNPVIPDARRASQDIYPLDGSLFTASGGDVAAVDSDASLTSGSGLTWAQFSFGGFDAQTLLGNIEVVFNSDLSGTEPGAGVYIGIANFSRQSWDWYLGSAPSFSFTPAVAADYVSAGGSIYVTVLLYGTGTATVDVLNITRTGAGAIPEAPTNLQGSTTFFSCTLTWDPVPGAVGYLVFRTQNPDGGVMQRITASPVPDTTYTDLSVASLSTYYYAVSAVRQAIGVKSELLDLTTLEEDLAAPQNLHLTPQPLKVNLAWSAVQGAESYNIYRATKSDFSNESLVNVLPVEPTAYIDTTPSGGKINFYRVRAKRSSEGPASDPASCYVPVIDLPAPTDLHLIKVIEDKATVGWNWSGAAPARFKVFVKQIPDFQLEPPYFFVADLDGSVRESTFSGLQSGQLYYVRVCAANASNQYGTMSDALEVKADGYWTLGPLEDVGPGAPKLSLLSEEGNLTAAYFNGTDINVARRDDMGAWTSEGVLTGGYTDFMDIARAKTPGGPYIVTSVLAAPLDLYAAVGRPGEGWTTELVDGDGTEGDLFSPENGFFCKVAASTDTFAVMSLEVVYLNQGPPFPETNKCVFQSRPISGGAWTRDYVFSTKSRQPLSFSLVDRGGTFFALRRDLDSAGFWFGSSTDTFATWTDISAGMNVTTGLDNDMHDFNGAWISPACNTTDDALEFFTEDAGTWSRAVIDPDSGTPDRSQMAIVGSDLFVVSRAFGTGIWEQSIFSNADQSWTHQAIFLPDGVFCQRMDIAELGGIPYILFDNPVDDHLYCCTLVEPQN